MAELALKNTSGRIVGVVLVDDADAPLVRTYRWHLRTGYVCGRKKGGGESVYMHRLLLGVDAAVQVDHVNRNRLDNRRANLRVVTTAENRQNKSLYRNNTSGHRGISRKDGKWLATVRVGGATRFSARFEHIEDAVVAVKAARAIHMPFSEEALAMTM